MSEHQVVDITIIGGGPVGLAAAYYGGHRDGSVRIIQLIPAGTPALVNAAYIVSP